MGSAQTVYDKTELEYRVNKYTLHCMRILLLCLGVVWLANLANLFIVNQRLMTGGVIMSSIPVIGTLIFAKFVDLRKRWVKYVILFTTTLAITIISSALTYHAVLLSVIPLLIATQYINRKMVIYAYVLTIIGMFVIVMGGYKNGLCDANMLLLTTEPTKYYMDALTNGTYTDMLNTNPAVTLPLFYVLPRCILLLLLLPIINSIGSNTMGYAEYASSMKMRSEIDDMTGLYNKNKYLEMKAQYYLKIENISVIFWDVNGLKETNDSLGHEKGDFLIKMVGDCIGRLTNDHSKAYRIGGDEFVMIVENPAANEVELISDRWDKMIQLCNKVADIPCSVAMGIASGAGRDVEKLAKEADQKMYQDKASGK